MRVRLFAGYEITRLEIGDNVLDASSRSWTRIGSRKVLGSDVVALRGDRYVDVKAFTSGGAALERRYSGTLFVQLRGDGLFVINEVDLETYVASVMSAEVSPGWATEALRAQAIAVRTYAEHARLARAAREYDLNDDTSSQVYRGVETISQSLWSAAYDTAYTLLTVASGPAPVFYSSSCGGHTAAAIELTGQPSPAHLNGVSDLDPSGRAYCSGAPYFRWKNTVTTASLARIFGVPSEQLNSVAIVERWPDGRVKSITATTPDAGLILSGREFYSRALRVLGYKVVPSAFFDIMRDGAKFVLVGHGVGHGVGMCQWGARGRADAGMSADEILFAYFPGTGMLKGPLIRMID